MPGLGRGRAGAEGPGALGQGAGEGSALVLLHWTPQRKQMDGIYLHKVPSEVKLELLWSRVHYK